ncbi:MAG TPA: hypothetical protein DCR94_00475 [Firmicutes bacterium]|nr:hypothetical protein [Bacillota bacterium]
MEKTVYPVIKWAGGKRRLAPVIASRFYDDGLLRPGATYFEPFLGGGALMFYLKHKNAVGIDQNPELINFYNVLKNDPEGLYEKLQKDFAPYHSETFYYEIRNRDLEADFMKKYKKVDRAARFVYLNKSCFNGIWRVNSKGHNNVPWNHQDKVSLPSLESVMAAHDYIISNNISFVRGDYKKVLDLAESGDLVYFDPPYDVEPLQSGFTSYTKQGFGRKEQKELKDICDELLRKGICVAISNSNTGFIKQLYTKSTDGYSLYTIVDENKLRLARTIAGKACSRRYVNELLIIGKPVEKSFSGISLK